MKTEFHAARPDVLAFDVYGTLIDPDSLSETLRPVLGNDAESVSAAWRARQLTLAFRRGLMGRYVDFAVCTADALRAVLAEQGHEVDEQTRQDWMDAYGALPAHDDAAEGLRSLRGQGIRLVAFSNGTEAAMKNVLANAGLLELFDELVSVDDIKRFKPDPQVYLHLLRRMNSEPSRTWLVSSNAWDIQGARHTGLGAAWIKRSHTAIEDEDLKPLVTVSSLVYLSDALPPS
ncbi:haloacid dehalogenase type II [Larsenimonas rhizosphaerae]|uniref:(S)-2-haloacid dehalogenase n=1 Tax=Larsenimonas rhizosphaerae TaxID=2944682 RepID=A0AA41ZMG5_9GAMM|nr:haloacid dehalogenase type II [Larsenimonas rhizosphaerae]MCM2131752.1 haloacid dehalogenase type II [Larsenimonas rhizosphaerae]MCX2524921.1 haloacid dehalogenase type II [Larsenimonas rhizosphaerae]